MHRAGGVGWGGVLSTCAFRGALWSMCSGWLGLITGGQFEVGISALNRLWGDICGKWGRKEGRGLGSAETPQPLEQRDLCVGGALQCALYFRTSDLNLTAVIIQLNPSQQFKRKKRCSE